MLKAESTGQNSVTVYLKSQDVVPSAWARFQLLSHMKDPVAASAWGLSLALALLVR